MTSHKLIIWSVCHFFDTDTMKAHKGLQSGNDFILISILPLTNTIYSYVSNGTVVPFK